MGTLIRHARLGLPAAAPVIALMRIPGHVNNHSGDVNNGFRLM